MRPHARVVPHLAHPCPRTDQEVRRFHGRGRHRLRCRDRRIVRVPGAERRRQDLDDADDRLCLADHERCPQRDGDGPSHTRVPDPGEPRRRATDGHARRRADGPREPVDLRPLLRLEPGRGRTARRRVARVRPAHRARQRPGRAAVGRDEAEADHRPVIDQRAHGPPPRRTDDGARPAGAPPAMGSPLPPEAARRDAGPDDPLHGRGRAAVRPAGRHGQGQDRRPGSQRRSTASSTGSRSASNTCPTASCSTPTTARRQRSPSTNADSSPRRSSSAGRRSRTSSCA